MPREPLVEGCIDVVGAACLCNLRTIFFDFLIRFAAGAYDGDMARFVVMVIAIGRND